MDYSSLISQAKEAKEKAVAPYSNFRVGAVVVAKSGRIYSGCNIESSSFSLTICAERVALFKAISEGEKEIETLVIVTDSEDFCPPCGACRQVLWDFGEKVTVVLANCRGQFKVTTLPDLLPEAFGAHFMGDKKTLPKLTAKP